MRTFLHTREGGANAATQEMSLISAITPSTQLSKFSEECLLSCSEVFLPVSAADFRGVFILLVCQSTTRFYHIASIFYQHCQNRSK